MAQPLILCDMDGVLANFVKKLLICHCRYDLLELNEQGEFPRTWEMDGELGTDDEIWWPVDIAGSDFWSDIDPYPWMDKLLGILESTGIPWYICTTARMTAESHAGKIDWIHRHIGNIDNVIMTKHKHVIAHENSLLIDDAEHNINAFESNGGNGFLFPQCWNGNAGKSRLIGTRLAIEEVFGQEVLSGRRS